MDNPAVSRRTFADMQVHGANFDIRASWNIK
jgi:hypothetical protein